MPPTNPAMNTVSRLVSSGQFRKAVPELERLVAAEPNDPRLRLFLADAHMRAGAPQAAVAQLMTAAARYERDGSGLKAMAVHLQVLRLAPGHREALVGLGRHHADLGLHTDAAASFGEALAATSAPADRLAVLQALLDVDPDNLADRLRLAEAWSAHGHMQEAARELRVVADALEHKADDTVWARVAERLLYHQPDDVAHAKRLATHYLGERSPQLALPRLRNAYEARPRDVEVLSLLADAFAQLGQSQKAIACLKEMVAVFDQSGLTDDAAEAWHRVLALDPNDHDARAALTPGDSDVAGQTFDLPLGQFEQAYRARKPSGSNPGRAATESDGRRASHPVRPDGRRASHPVRPDDEVGFDAPAENTIVDKAWIPPPAAAGGIGLTFGPPRTERPASGSQPGLSSGSAPGSSGLSSGSAPGSSGLSSGSAPGSSGLRGVESELKELDFYLQTGLLAEAETLLTELRSRFGDHPELVRRAARLSGGPG